MVAMDFKLNSYSIPEFPDSPTPCFIDSRSKTEFRLNHRFPAKLSVLCAVLSEIVCLPLLDSYHIPARNAISHSLSAVQLLYFGDSQSLETKKRKSFMYDSKTPRCHDSMFCSFFIAKPRVVRCFKDLILG